MADNMENQVVLESRIQQRNDIAAQWKSVNPVLLKGEMGIEIDTGLWKFGDGITAWNDLEYVGTNLERKSAKPLASDTAYEVGTFWLNETDGEIYVLFAKTDTAVWVRLLTPDDVAVVAESQVAQKLKTARTISIAGDGTGSASFDGSANATIELILKNTGVAAGTYTKLTVDEKGLIVSAAQLTAGDIPELTLSKISDAGTAAAKNVGIGVGNVVEVGADGKISDSILPPLAITEPFAVESEAAMLALSAQKGDVAIRADINKSFILKQAPATTLANWLELKSPDCKVLSVNGKTGAVSLVTTDVAEGSNKYYTEARASANFNTNFPLKASSDLADGASLMHKTDVFILNGGNA